MNPIPDPRQLTIQEIAAILARSDPSTIPQDFLALLAEDSRQGVHRLLSAYYRSKDRSDRLARQWQAMCRFERPIWEAGGLVCGVDEAGRGPLAGPVVAAAVILPPDCYIPGLTDSKALSPQKRDELLTQITAVAVDYAVGIVEPAEIDRLNILQATYQAMALAVRDLQVDCQCILIDGNSPCPHLSQPQRAIVKGDALSVSIAAASILAKQTRDALMVDLDALYPGYGFAEHKGYPTSDHLAALARLGPSPIHRRSFAPVSTLCEKEPDHFGPSHIRESR